MGYIYLIIPKDVLKKDTVFFLFIFLTKLSTAFLKFHEITIHWYRSSSNIYIYHISVTVSRTNIILVNIYANTPPPDPLSENRAHLWRKANKQLELIYTGIFFERSQI